MARYGQAFKDKAVARLLPPESAAPSKVAREVGVGVDTLERWRSEALSKPARERTWTAAARCDAVLGTAAMDEAGKSAWCRANGVCPQDLVNWRQSATQALAEPEEARASPSQTKQDRRRIKELERELRRKNAALARRKIVGWEVHASDDSLHAAHLVRRTALVEGIATMASSPCCKVTTAQRSSPRPCWRCCIGWASSRRTPARG